MHSQISIKGSVLKHANVFMHLFEGFFEFLARVRSAQRYLERLPPPMFKAVRAPCCWWLDRPAGLTTSM